MSNLLTIRLRKDSNPGVFKVKGMGIMPENNNSGPGFEPEVVHKQPDACVRSSEEISENSSFDVMKKDNSSAP